MSKALVHEIHIVWQIMWMMEKDPNLKGVYYEVITSKELWDIYTTIELAEEEAARAKKDDDESGLICSRYTVTTHTVKDAIGE